MCVGELGWAQLDQNLSNISILSGFLIQRLPTPATPETPGSQSNARLLVGAVIYLPDISAGYYLEKCYLGNYLMNWTIREREDLKTFFSKERVVVFIFCKASARSFVAVVRLAGELRIRPHLILRNDPTKIILVTRI